MIWGSGSWPFTSPPQGARRGNQYLQWGGQAGVCLRRLCGPGMVREVTSVNLPPVSSMLLFFVNSAQEAHTMTDRPFELQYHFSSLRLQRNKHVRAPRGATFYWWSSFIQQRLDSHLSPQVLNMTLGVKKKKARSGSSGTHSQLTLYRACYSL